MRAIVIQLVSSVFLVVCLGCSTEQGQPATVPGPPGAEACPGTFEICVDLCKPLGVKAFGCWSETQNVDFDCECLDGSKPLERSLETDPAEEEKAPAPFELPETPDRRR